MRANQKWIVTLKFTEQEGENSPNPWYSRRDVEQLVRISLSQGQISNTRDLKLESIEAEPDGGIYY